MAFGFLSMLVFILLVHFFVFIFALLLFELERLGSMMFCHSCVMLVIFMPVFHFGQERLMGMMLGFILVMICFVLVVLIFLIMLVFIFVVFIFMVFIIVFIFVVLIFFRFLL